MTVITDCRWREILTPWRFPIGAYRIYSRNSRIFFNQNFVSNFRVRDLCEETILRWFIMKLKCDNQWENATIYLTETYSGPLCVNYASKYGVGVCIHTHTHTHIHTHTHTHIYIYIYIYTYRLFQEECTRDLQKVVALFLSLFIKNFKSKLHHFSI